MAQWLDETIFEEELCLIKSSPPIRTCVSRQICGSSVSTVVFVTRPRAWSKIRQERPGHFLSARIYRHFASLVRLPQVRLLTNRLWKRGWKTPFLEDGIQRRGSRILKL